MLWHFQGVHHDIWDRDFPSPPALVTVRARRQDGWTQWPKPPSRGSSSSLTVSPASRSSRSRSARFPPQPFLARSPLRTQPVPVMPLRLTLASRLTADMLTTRTAEAHALGRRAVQGAPQRWSLRPFFASISKPSSFPASMAAANGEDHGGRPALGCYLYQLKRSAMGRRQSDSKQARRLAGEVDLSDPLCRLPRCRPSWRSARLSVVGRRTDQSLSGRRSGRSSITARDVCWASPTCVIPGWNSCLIFLTTQRAYLWARPRALEESLLASASPTDARYHFTGYRKFLDPDGYPAVVPPWGTLNAIDLNTGKYIWKVSLGQLPRAGGEGAAGHRFGELRWPYFDRWRRTVCRRDDL